MKKILITGTDGFIGNILKNLLSAAGYDVYGTVFLREPCEKEWRVDITKADDFNKLPSIAFDAVIHNAGMVQQNVPRKLMFEVNAEGTKKLVQWAETNQCKHFIQISSIGVYGLKSMGQNRLENTTCRFLSLSVPYQQSKAKAEKYISLSSIPYTILRLPAVIGSGDTVITPSIAPRLLDGTYFSCGAANKKISLITVKSLAKLIMPVIDKKPTNEIYNCVSHHVSWSVLVNEYANNINKPVPKTKKSLLSAFTHLFDKHYLFLLVNSRFGAHFPNEKFINTFNIQATEAWQDAVRESVLNFQSG